MSINYNSKYIKQIGEHGVYLGSQNTNCLTYTPKNVDLELNDGTLTLKAGSKVYIPNGAGVFDTITISTDKTFTYTANGQYLIVVTANGDMNRCSYPADSGTTEPTASVGALWYDITNNLIKRNNGTQWQNRSFPIAIITVSGGAISSIDQIFDWCGYIGTAIFRLPNVSCYKPDGLNADGTYKSIEDTDNKVAIRNQTYTITGTLVDYGNNRLEIIEQNAWLEVDDTLPTAQAFYQRCYVKSENKMYFHTATDLNWTLIPSNLPTAIADCSIDVSTNTVTLTPYTAQPETTVIPINAIYNGSEKVYQYHPYEPGHEILYGANTGTMTYTLPKGVYQCCVVGGGWRNQASWSKAGGAAAEIRFRLTTKTTVVVSSGGLGVDGYLNINGARIVTARTPTIEQGGTNTYTIDTSSSYYVSTVYASNGNGANLSVGASVSPYETWGAGTKAGGARLAYVGA